MLLIVCRLIVDSGFFSLVWIYVCVWVRMFVVFVRRRVGVRRSMLIGWIFIVFMLVILSVGVGI